MTKINILFRLLIYFLAISLLCFCFYKVGQRVGRNEAQIKIVEKKVEVIRYVEKQKAKIYSRPNAHRTDLLKLMYNNQL